MAKVWVVFYTDGESVTWYNPPNKQSDSSYQNWKYIHSSIHLFEFYEFILKVNLCKSPKDL